MTRQIEVAFSPALLPLFEVKGKTVVVIDILRATTSICVAFHTGVQKILPVATPEEAWSYREFDFLAAAERNAVKVPGFDLGNSPYEFENPLLKDKKIAFTTTNGTKAIRLARELGAAKILIGSFLNMGALLAQLATSTQDIILLCAGWKDKFNLEDTLFAGALTDSLKTGFTITCDSALAAGILYNACSNDLEKHVRQSSHAQRFKLLNAGQDDVKYCLQTNTLDIVPVMHGEYLVGG